LGIAQNIATEYSRAATSSGVKSRFEQLGQHVAQPRQLMRIWLLGEAGGFLKLLGALLAAFLALDDLATRSREIPNVVPIALKLSPERRGATICRLRSLTMATVNPHRRLDAVGVPCTVRDAHRIILDSHGLFVLKSCRFAGSPRGRNASHWKCWCAVAASAKVLEICKPLRKDTYITSLAAALHRTGLS
jgi:hypothetical protein